MQCPPADDVNLRIYFSVRRCACSDRYLNTTAIIQLSLWLYEVNMLPNKKCLVHARLLLWLELADRFQCGGRLQRSNDALPSYLAEADDLLLLYSQSLFSLLLLPATLSCSSN